MMQAGAWTTPNRGAGRCRVSPGWRSGSREALGAVCISERGLSVLELLLALATSATVGALAIALTSTAIDEMRTAVAARDKDVAHCRVLGRIDTEINFTALLPDRWNGNFFGGGADMPQGYVPPQ